MSEPTKADFREAEQWLREHRWLRGNSATRQRNAAQLALLLARIREAETKRAEKAEANYQFMVDRAANEKLDGYRALGARAAEAETARDEAVREAAAARGLADTLQSQLCDQAALRAEVEALKAQLEQAEKDRDEAKSVGNTLLNSAYVCVDPSHEGLDEAHRAGRQEALREVLPWVEHEAVCTMVVPADPCSCRVSALRAEAEGGEG